MGNGVKQMNVEAAAEDLQNRTLAQIPGELARLVYLASTRDYNTGRYYHDGLAFRFTEEVAASALAVCHRETFRRLALSSLEEVVQQLESFLRVALVPPTAILEVWKKLEPYRVAIPLDCDPLLAELFFSNIRIALAILETRRAESLAG